MMKRLERPRVFPSYETNLRLCQAMDAAEENISSLAAKVATANQR
jgi:hypothetical protein